ncbi:MAG: metalloregulator ArsR/SmtB family transcription factor [Candidatus Bathyarchaeota archaeon]|nr:metalloregulator ArsR/SmtB family transcription factor [Candidatus Bathyarchaeota archaeon]
MQESDYEDRVQRLVTSGLCPSKDASKYAKELKELAHDKIDEKSIKEYSKIFKAISDPTRIRIIGLLSIRDMCVCEIMVSLDMTQPTASHHLNILENADLVKSKREGKWMFYGLTNPDILKFINKIKSLV